MAKALDYAEFRNFIPVIERAKEACKNRKHPIANHFVDFHEMVSKFWIKGLYGGIDAKGIHAKKGLKKNEQILDHMGSTELAANLFRATQTEEKLRRENIKGKRKVNQTHFEVGKKVRKTIEELGGTMPENLPVANSIKKLVKRERAKKLKGKKKK